MRNLPSKLAFIFFISMGSSCSDQIAANESINEFPPPVDVYDDSNEQRAAPPEANSSVVVEPPTYAEFECAANAPFSTAGMQSRTEDRIENGETLSVTYYAPAGVRVFGLEARALERFRSRAGAAGVAAYVAADRAAIRRAILARYPDAVITGDTIRAAGMGGPIALQDAENQLVRIACFAPAGEMP